MPTYHCKLDKFATRSFAKLAKHYRTKHAEYMQRRRAAARGKARESRSEVQAPRRRLVKRFSSVTEAGYGVPPEIEGHPGGTWHPHGCRCEGCRE
jgi:hypothetical protein